MFAKEIALNNGLCGVGGFMIQPSTVIRMTDQYQMLSAEGQAADCANTASDQTLIGGPSHHGTQGVQLTETRQL